MKLTIEPTGRFSKVNMIEAAVWIGRTESGIPVEVRIHTMRCTDSARQAMYESEVQAVNVCSITGKGLVHE